MLIWIFKTNDKTPYLKDHGYTSSQYCNLYYNETDCGLFYAGY